MASRLSDQERLLQLERQLQQALQREQQALQEKQQEKLEKQQALQEKQQALQEKQQALQEIQDTTLHEYLQYYHEYLSKPLSIQEKDRATGGTTTKPDGKVYPTTILPWDGFLDLQQVIFHDLYEAFHPPSQPLLRLLKPRIAIVKSGPEICRKPLGSETDLGFYQNSAVQIPTTNILYTLSKMSHPVVETWKVEGGVEFENHSNTLSNDNDEVQERHRLKKKATPRPRTDQICVHRIRKDGSEEEERLTRAFIIEYKAPHKISVEGLRRALSNENLCTDVIRRRQQPYMDDRLQEKADEIVAKTICQTFDYMVETCLEYGYITTGEAFVFCRIKEGEVPTLYYHMVVPNEEVSDYSRSSIFRTAVAQVASFCLMTFRSKTRDMTWQDKAKEELQRWPAPYENISHDISDEETARAPSRSPTPYEPSPPPRYTGQSARSTCKQAEIIQEESDDDHSDGPARANPTDARTSSKRKQAPTANESSEGGRVPSETRHQARQYCTQACLVGLDRGFVLDENCPNVSSHRASESSTRHPLDTKEFARQVREQLAENRDRDCKSLGKQGARGALFRLVLARYGYTFVAKGTVSAFVPDLQYEGRVYQRLKRIQGEAVPVYLGNIDLVKGYDLAPGVLIVHMLLMSWAGEEADRQDVPDLSREVERTRWDVLAEGVIHGDEREPNMLWNDERRRVMWVDFERSRFFPAAKRQALLEMSKRKRQQCSEAPEICQKKRLNNGMSL